MELRSASVLCATKYVNTEDVDTHLIKLSFLKKGISVCPPPKAPAASQNAVNRVCHACVSTYTQIASAQIFFDINIVADFVLCFMVSFFVTIV